ncbi:hypothetical protein GF322_02560 [Candidatus Dependentiae bacterium]|nr:hypothetical protein [Candidatus Dependentiae bacterium]
MANNLENIKKWGADNLTGILAIIAGIILLVITYKIILNIIIFSVGAMLIYFGLARLKIKSITNFIDNMINKFKSIISS